MRQVASGAFDGLRAVGRLSLLAMAELRGDVRSLVESPEKLTGREEGVLAWTHEGHALG